ncbi:MAG: hypothetical protein LBR53_09015 [Deltaproteobacteria bacterium]|jgi:alpha-glucosidase|nr:hypothetical protein [Deltaproteobacteria bacterium]
MTTNPDSGLRKEGRNGGAPPSAPAGGDLGFRTKGKAAGRLGPPPLIFLRLPGLLFRRLPGLLSGLPLPITSLLLFLLLLFPGALRAAPVSTPFGEYTLTQAKIREGMWYFQISKEPRPLSDTLNPSPMLNDPASIRTDGADFTPFPVVTLNGEPTVTVLDKENRVVFSFSAFSPENQLAGIVFYGDDYTHVSGLGASFGFSSSKINHLGSVFDPNGNTFGTTFERGDPARQVLEHASGLQAPVCYVLGPEKRTAALFVNETRPLFWDFSSYPWTVTLKGPLPPSGAIGFFILTGDDLPAVRRAFMSLAGRSPAPPRSIFYPWILEKPDAPPKGVQAADHFTKLRELFPEFKGLGFVYSTLNSPLPYNAAKGAGVELLAEESPYVPVSSPYFPELSKRGFLVRSHTEKGSPLILTYNGVSSGLLDYTNPAAASYWHSLERGVALDMGASVFYLTGGEPEVYSPFAWYRGVSDPSSHSHYAWANRFSLKWMESLNGSFKHQLNFFTRRTETFILSRSGLGGMSRFGAGLFTVDPNLPFPQVAAQARAHLNLSGVDYYTTDATPFMGFLDLSIAEPLYEAWFSRNALLNLPLMLPKDFIDLPWARQILYQKAKLEPYYYSWSHQIAFSGDPMSAPLFYYFQEDQVARERSFETMLGPHMLIAAGVTPAAETVDVYLPAGRWYSLLDDELIVSESGMTVNLPAKQEGMQQPPILLRAGAIVPTWREPENPQGLPSVVVFPGDAPTSFLWYEEDASVNLNPQDTDDRVTITSLVLTPKSGGEGPLLEFSIKSDAKNIPKGQDSRAYFLEFVGIGNVRTATLDGELHDRVTSVSELDRLESGWSSSGNGKLVFKTPPVSLSAEHVIEIR